MKEKIKELLSDVVKLQMEVCMSTDWTPSVSIQSYIAQVHLYKKGWKIDDYIQAEIKLPMGMFKDMDMDKLNHSVDQLRSVKYQFQCILKRNEINRDKLKEYERIEYEYYF